MLRCAQCTSYQFDAYFLPLDESQDESRYEPAAMITTSMRASKYPQGHKRCSLTFALCFFPALSLFFRRLWDRLRPSRRVGALETIPSNSTSQTPITTASKRGELSSKTTSAPRFLFSVLQVSKGASNIGKQWHNVSAAPPSPKRGDSRSLT